MCIRTSELCKYEAPRQSCGGSCAILSGEEGGGSELHMQAEKQLLGKHLFPGPAEMQTHRDLRDTTLISRPCGVSPTTQSIFFVDVSADSSMPGRGPFSKSFHAVRWEARRKASFLFLKNDQPK